MINYDLNKPYEGDIAIYNGVKFVYIQGKWYTFDDAMNMTFYVQC
jgi:hypothetical protein